MEFIRRDIFLKIELIKDYSPLAPLLCARRYGRDCMFTEGHESGRVTPAEILSGQLDALVYREYLDPHYTIPNTGKIVNADVNEPPWDRRVPGAVLFAKPGERLYIHVLNSDQGCHSLHLHGLRYGIDSDGAWPFGVGTTDGRRSDEIRPGEKWVYVFDATPQTIGAWAFHDHVRDVQRNVNRGLFGGLIVRDPAAPCVEHEVPLFLHQMAGVGGGPQFESKALGSGDTFSFTFGSAPGTAPYICKIHGASMTGQVNVVAGGPATANVTIANLAFSPATITVGTGGTVTWKNIDRVLHIVYAAGGGGSNYCLNGRSYVGNTPTIVAPSGDRLRWYVFNLDLGDIWHNFHPHSTRWQLPAPPGGAGDVHSLSPAESFVAETEVPIALRLPCALQELQCDPPPGACRVRLKGDFLFHCHLEEHMMAGLAGLVRAQQYVWITPDVVERSGLELPYDDGANDCGCVDLLRCRPHRVEQPPTRPDTPIPGMPGMPAMGSTPTAVFDATQLSTKGMWETLPCNSQILAVHAALLRTGKVLFFAGSGNDPDKLAAGDMRSVVWDYESGEFHRPKTPIDVFCAGHAFLADGKLLVAGGTERYDPFHGLKAAYLFDPLLEEWIRIQDMADGRWYPSLVTLGDGRVLAVSGLSAAGPPNRVPEIFAPGFNWSSLPSSPGDWPTYPHLFLMKDGRIFYSGGQMGGTGVPPGLLTLPANSFTPITLPADFDAGNRDQSFSVLLPPAQTQRVMIAGGGGAATNKAHIADLSVATPTYTATAPMHFARMHALGVLLPDRTVLITGGSVMGEDPSTGVLDAEIYHPDSGTWTVAARSTVPRVYHGVAILLPDGRVITAGSNPNRKDDELRLELFHPPYLFRGPRPFIESAPAAVTYGATVEIETPQAQHIKWAQLIHPMATTHSSDTSQRLVDLPIQQRCSCTLKVCIPCEPNLAPPGWYMLSVTDKRGVPSVAKWVRLDMDEQLKTIKTIKVHPAIGIARVGNSRTEFFVGPEIPGVHSAPDSGYKDAKGHVKRQAARFRLFGYDGQGNLVKEITSDDAAITWTTHLANKKAAWRQFDGLNAKAPWRNAAIKDRKQLTIDPGPRSLSGPGQVAEFDTGKFMGHPVPLGAIRTDDQCRLLVLGGHGSSDSPTHAPLTTFADNDGWHDDVSDGPVTAKVTLYGAMQPLQATGAWVIVAPPKFAPPISNIITLYDVLLQIAVQRLGLILPTTPSFTRDIYPLLQRAIDMSWVSGMAAMAHAHASLSTVIPPPGSAAARKAIFDKLRDPALAPDQDSGESDMPMIWSDYYTASGNQPLTPIQYSNMKKWKDGLFIDDWAGPPTPPTLITPEGLDRAALEPCVGAAFYPGIEASWMLRDVFHFIAPFRLDLATLAPGDATKQMAVPWQADFTDCAQDGELAWWPAQRPDDVFPEGGGPQVSWTRSLVTSMQDMVTNWYRLGFVVRQGDQYVETERT